MPTDRARGATPNAMAAGQGKTAAILENALVVLAAEEDVARSAAERVGMGAEDRHALLLREGRAERRAREAAEATSASLRADYEAQLEQCRCSALTADKVSGVPGGGGGRGVRACGRTGNRRRPRWCCACLAALPSFRDADLPSPT